MACETPGNPSELLLLLESSLILEPPGMLLF